MVKYTKKVDKKISKFLKGNYENPRKYIQILLKFHFETIEPSIGFIVNQLQNFKNFGIIKVGNNYV
jgi:hypothetical protein